MGHAQHDPAEYVPKEMREYWEKRDPILLHEKFLTEAKLLDVKTKKEIETKIEALLSRERDFAENSPMPPPELAEKGVYCSGDDCHKIQPKWERPVAEVTPPKSSIDASWVVEGFGRGKSSGGGTAPIHFGDTAQSEERKEVEEKLAPARPVEVVIKDAAAKNAASNGRKAEKARAGKDASATNRKAVANVVGKSVKAAAKVPAKSVARKGRR
jgi:hypothetical protein